MFTLTIHTDNAAFEAEPEREVARIVGVIGNHLLCGVTAAEVLDINGNVCGTWRLAAEPDEIGGEPCGDLQPGDEALPLARTGHVVTQPTPWLDLLYRLVAIRFDGARRSLMVETDRWQVWLHEGTVYVNELGEDDVYWPVATVPGSATRPELGALLQRAYDATVDAVAAAGHPL